MSEKNDLMRIRIRYSRFIYLHIGTYLNVCCAIASGQFLVDSLITRNDIVNKMLSLKNIY